MGNNTPEVGLEVHRTQREIRPQRHTNSSRGDDGVAGPHMVGTGTDKGWGSEACKEALSTDDGAAEGDTRHCGRPMDLQDIGQEGLGCMRECLGAV